jgi:hypothetical protein
MKAKTKIEEIKRKEKLHQLMDARAQQFPSEDYDERFAAVANSEEGQQLFCEMHFSKQDPQFFGNAYPLKDTRSLSLVGLPATATQAEFEAAWEKYNSQRALEERAAAGGKPLTSSGASSQTPAKPKKPDFEGDAGRFRSIEEARQERSEAVKIFNDELARLQAEGKTYDEAHSIASSTPPGKDALARWYAALETIKRLGG